MSGSQRSDPRFFQGATISLGPLDIKGKNFEDFTKWDVAYIVGRYMNANADGYRFVGSVSRVIKSLWPDADVDSKYLRGIYRILKHLGYTHKTDRYGTDYWMISQDVDDKYRDKVPIRKVEPSPITYRCLHCGSPFDNKQTLKNHILEMHPALVHIEDALTVEKGADMVKTPETTVLPPKAEAKPEEMVRCGICDKEVTPQGLGGHMNGHRLSKQMKNLLDAIKQDEGLHPRDYAVLLDKSPSAVSGIGIQLSERGLIQRVGNRQNCRYYLADTTPPKKVDNSSPAHGRRQKSDNGRKHRRKDEKGRFIPAPKTPAKLVGFDGEIQPQIRPAYILTIGNEEYVLDGAEVRHIQ